MRQRAQRRLGKAFGRQRQRLARQPFEIAVLAHMHDRVGAKPSAEPGIEGEIAVRRRADRVVIARLRDRCCSRAPAASRPTTLPKRNAAMAKAPQSSRLSRKNGIALGRAPALRRPAPARRAAGSRRRRRSRCSGKRLLGGAAAASALVGPASRRAISASPSRGNSVDAIAGGARARAAPRSRGAACRGRRRCRCGRRDADNWRAPARCARSAGGVRRSRDPVAREIGDESDAVGAPAA